MEKLDKVFETRLCSQDNWGYIIKVYEDVTELWYFEENTEPKLVYTLPLGDDIQIAEEIIRLRKQKNLEEGI